MSSFQIHFHDFKCDLVNTCVSYLFYSHAKPSCLIIFYLVPDIEPIALEAEQAEEAVEPPVERE